MQYVSPMVVDCGVRDGRTTSLQVDIFLAGGCITDCCSACLPPLKCLLLCVVFVCLFVGWWRYELGTTNQPTNRAATNYFVESLIRIADAMPPTTTTPDFVSVSFSPSFAPSLSLSLSESGCVCGCDFSFPFSFSSHQFGYSPPSVLSFASSRPFRRRSLTTAPPPPQPMDRLSELCK